MRMQKRGIYEKIINIVLDILIILFGIFLLISIYNNVQIKILGNQYSSFFGYSTFEVQTGSMADTINPGDWIIVKGTKDVKLDDIITYAHEGEFITHRVVETYKDSFVTKGDANNSKDDAISKQQVVGKVVKILPFFGIIRKTFFNPLVLLTLILTLYSISYVLRSSTKKNVNTTDSKLKYREKVDSLVDFVLTKLLEYIKTKIKNKDIFENKEQSLNDTVEEVFDTNDLQIEIPEMNKEAIDKTLYFRRISVDKTEIENIELNDKDDDSNVIEEEVEVDIDSVVQNEIEEKINLINNKKKKFKNIVEKAMYFKKEEINRLVEALRLDGKLRSNEITIKETLLDKYIDGKYYNYCGDVNVEFNKRNVLPRIERVIQEVGEDLIKNYKGSDTKYSDKVKKYVDIFTVVNELEHINMTTTLEIKDRREIYKEKILKTLNLDDLTEKELKDMINEIIKTQKLYQRIINYILEKANTNAFNLELNKVASNKNLFAVSLKHNIAFSKVFSEYIVDKTYDEGIIAEDKIMVLLNLLHTNIVKDMLDLEENKKYFMHIPYSIYLKPNKLDKIFKLFEDEYAKNNIIIVVDSKNLIEYGRQITRLRKKGYLFALVVDSETNFSDNKYIKVVEYLFIDKKIMSYSLISKIPDDLSVSIINDDIMSKLSSFGGE